MKNPFEYGGIVGPDAFCNRETEQKDLRRAAENGDRLLIYAERRMGKTSLVRNVMGQLPAKNYLPIYVDLWTTSNPQTFAEQVAKATAESADRRADKILETAKDLFRYMSPSVTIDDYGNPSIQFGARLGAETVPQLEDVLRAPLKLAAKRKKRVVVVLDEIQRIAEYSDDMVERTLRTVVQEPSEVAWFFLGSRKHVIQQMFSDRSRPLYQSTGHYPLEAIHVEHWTPFIARRFQEAGKTVSIEVIEQLCERTDGHPYYTQHLAHDLWEITAVGEVVTDEALREAEALLLRRLSHSYTVLWDALTTNQRALLRGLAQETSGHSLFSAEFLARVGMAGSSAHRAAEGLQADDIIDRSPDGYVISDRFLRRWLVSL